MNAQPNVDWQAGDLAICLTHPDGMWKNCLTGAAQRGPSCDQVTRVTDTANPLFELHPTPLWLEFDEYPGLLWPASDFRKIVPDQAGACDREIVALIKGHGRKVAA